MPAAHGPGVLRAWAGCATSSCSSPGGGSYTQATVNGVTVAGFNDPRWFGDDNRNNAAKQTPAAGPSTARTPVARRPTSWSPRAGRRPGGRRRRHPRQRPPAHRPARGQPDRRRHVHRRGHGQPLRAGRGEEGRPRRPWRARRAALRVRHRGFGRSCTLTSLTRYTFRNLIQGRPAYDDVQVINGSTIQPAAPGSTRSCSEGSGLEVAPVAEPPVTLDAGPTP